MEATSLETRKLDGDKAQRIVAAMRASVGARGAAGSTFDLVAREAGVSRGLLHYYFGSKERLLVEVVRRDCDERIAALEHALERADSVDEIVQALVASLEAFVQGEPGAQAVLYEMVSASRHSEEIRVELAELYRRWRALLAGALRQKEREGIVTLDADADSVASILFALGDGLGLQLTSDPAWVSRGSLELGMRTARRLLGAGV
ncbi:MAG TPA: TetR/AcrR family transcriptional regulator [Thermoleophilaceae bacterium]|nr:TetR/AcrR family transcriptional regulator [Thermoleophilaceae bacterium]